MGWLERVCAPGQFAFDLLKSRADNSNARREPVRWPGGVAMKTPLFLLASIVIPSLPMAVKADSLVPAGTLIDCTITEPNFSSKTAAKGDPVLCYASPLEKFSSRTVLPYGSYLSGRFEDYRDPGHFVGKGWMELTFDRVVMGPGRVVPISAKVVKAPGLRVDKEGKIDGSGHATRDTIEWMIPVLWPEKVITLPMRGPRPTLKQETRLTLKIMDDFLVPDDTQPAAGVPSTGLRQRSALPRQFNGSVAAQPAVHYADQPVNPQLLALLVLKDGTIFPASNYWMGNSAEVIFISPDGVKETLPIQSLDLGMTIATNRQRGVGFQLRAIASQY